MMTLDEARIILKDEVQDDNSLSATYPWFTYHPGCRDACLDGHFKADELEAIAVWMREHSPG